MNKLKRRLMALSLSSVLAALGAHTSVAAPAVKGEYKGDYLLKRDRSLRQLPARGQGYLVRGDKGEYYFLTKSQLLALAHKGKCHPSMCAKISPAGIIVQKRALARFLLRGAMPFRRKLRDQRLVHSLNSSIQRRQALGAKVRVALAKQGFEVGRLMPTKAG